MMSPLLLLLLLSISSLSCVAAGGWPPSPWPPAQAAYDPATAYRALMYSAAAYSDLPEQCLPSLWNVAVPAHFTAKDSLGNPLFGFAGVNDQQQEIVLAFRGTEDSTQLFIEFLKTLTMGTAIPGSDAKVFTYFLDAASKLQDQVTNAATKLLAEYPSYRLLVTGHSLGAAIASVIASSLFYTSVIPSTTTVWQYTFGQPRVGNLDYAVFHDSFGITSYRLTHYRDPVIHLPFCHGLLECDAVLGTDYAYHHGVEVFYPATAMPPNAPSTVCLGQPYNEDQKCADGYLGDSISDHEHYFNIRVGKYCNGTSSIYAVEALDAAERVLRPNLPFTPIENEAQVYEFEAALEMYLAMKHAGVA